MRKNPQRIICHKYLNEQRTAPRWYSVQEHTHADIQVADTVNVFNKSIKNGITEIIHEWTFRQSNEWQAVENSSAHHVSGLPVSDQHRSSVFATLFSKICHTMWSQSFFFFFSMQGSNVKDIIFCTLLETRKTVDRTWFWIGIERVNYIIDI